LIGDWSLDDADDANGVNAMATMNSRRDDHHDTVVIDPAELEPTGPASSRAASGELVVSLARGTREQVVARAPADGVTERQLPRFPAPSGEITERQLPIMERSLPRIPAPAAKVMELPRIPEPRGHEQRDDRRERAALERDPVAVLRAWPHSTTTTAAPPPPPPREVVARPSPRGRRIQNKIVLAHLALDLFQEIDQLQAIVQRAHDGSACDPDSETCSDPRCAATVDVLRGALVEACLLVQRVAMMRPDEPLDIEDRIHELLELLHHTRPD
jgi:hypothetical protein